MQLLFIFYLNRGHPNNNSQDGDELPHYRSKLRNRNDYFFGSLKLRYIALSATPHCN